MSLLEKKLFLGLDESNNGKVPEIVVLTYSTKYNGTQKELLKGREINLKKKETIPEILTSQDFDFRFMVLYDDFFNELRSISKKQVYNIKHICQVYNFLTNLKKENILPKNYKLILDGKAHKPEVTEEFLKSKSLKMPVFKQKADKRVHLVNLADRLAHQFFRDLVVRNNRDTKKNLIGKYWKNRIYPNVDNSFKEYFTNYFENS